MNLLDRFHPITRRRIRRFMALRRAWWSFVILLAAYLLSLGAELLCNQDPLYLRFEGRHYFPVARFYSERTMLGEGPDTRIDYKGLVRGERFRSNPANRVVWPLIPNGPLEIIRPERIELPDDVRMRFGPDPRVATINVSPELLISRGVAAGYFFDGADGSEEGRQLGDDWALPEALKKAIEQRFNNEPASAITLPARRADGREAEFSMPPFTPRATPPRTLRITLREEPSRRAELRWAFTPDLQPASGEWPSIWSQLDEAEQQSILALAEQRFSRVVDPITVTLGDRPYRVRAEREDVRYPFRPVEGHPLGIDSAGRDVLARLIYGFRSSMTFAMLLVAASLAVGTLIGAAQGYRGGRIDLVGQRIIEIWDALPFLYILILMGSIYGRSFGLLLFCYALFNWIGISYYMRAEFLRLRNWPFVEAARAQGLPARLIMFRHMLPNALVPLVTFFPFSLVSAIGTLAALDFLGFGLPPPTPSWGELLSQAQEYPWAWWLTLYPALALFVVMLLGVFIGEGVRQAFDPKPYSRLE
ncbi:MAG TPA: ABC transporter permease subunit [Kiritimatiellia bacterium]|nr:ABC transporter permease subunit [Kiritimatiellia bacterium]